ncbi:hypothetical protein M8994_18330 [Brucella sp. 21LCYQ03]|nr:hypothetical protein [Brucella sp. 21LCYQ03]
MEEVYKISLIPGTPQSLTVVFGDKEYRLTLRFRDVDNNGSLWSLDIAEVQSNKDIVCGIPLVTGADLLAQYRHLNIPGSLIVHTDGEPDSVPAFENLGQDSNLYFVVQ